MAVFDAGFLNRVFTPAYFVAIGVTLGLNYVCSPVLFKSCVPVQKRKNLGPLGYLFSLLASTVHAVVSCTFAVYILTVGELGENRVFANSPLGYMAMQITLGYVTGDIFVCLADAQLRGMVSTLLHHLAMLLGIALGLYYNLFMFFIVYRFLAEFSTPWVNLRFFLSTFEQKNSKLYLFSSIAMLFSFFLSRIAVIPWHTYALHSALFSSDGLLVPAHLRLLMIVNFTSFDIINLFWFYKILRGAYKVFWRQMHHTD